MGFIPTFVFLFFSTNLLLRSENIMILVSPGTIVDGNHRTFFYQGFTGHKSKSIFIADFYVFANTQIKKNMSPSYPSLSVRMFLFFNSHTSQDQIKFLPYPKISPQRLTTTAFAFLYFGHQILHFSRFIRNNSWRIATCWCLMPIIFLASCIKH